MVPLLGYWEGICEKIEDRLFRARNVRSARVLTCGFGDGTDQGWLNSIFSQPQALGVVLEGLQPDCPTTPARFLQNPRPPLLRGTLAKESDWRRGVLISDPRPRKFGAVDSPRSCSNSCEGFKAASAFIRFTRGEHETSATDSLAFKRHHPDGNLGSGFVLWLVVNTG